MPTDCRRIKQNFRTLHCRKTRSLRKPLVPTNKHALTSELVVKSLESQIARIKIEFLVITRVVGNVHFAVKTSLRAVSINHIRRIVINAFVSFFKKRNDNHAAELFCKRRKMLKRNTAALFRKVKIIRIFPLTEIKRRIKFRQTDNVCAVF